MQDIQTPHEAMQATPEATLKPILNEVSDASDAETPANTTLSDASDASPPLEIATWDTKFDFTIEAARKIFFDHQRRTPAARTLQNYCKAGVIVSMKVPTTTGSEWVINEASLMNFIDSLPLIETISDATQATPEATLKPILNEVSDASDAETPVNTTLSDASDAGFEEAPQGEKRTVAQMLIENSKLLIDNAKLNERVEGRDREFNILLTTKDQVIGELKDDKKFLREEITEARKLRGDVKDMASQLMGTIRAAMLREHIDAKASSSPEPRNINPES